VALTVTRRSHDRLGRPDVAADQGIDQRGLACRHGAEDDHAQSADLMLSLGVKLRKLARQLGFPLRIADPVDEFASASGVHSGSPGQVIGNGNRSGNGLFLLTPTADLLEQTCPGQRQHDQEDQGQEERGGKAQGAKPGSEAILVAGEDEDQGG